MRGLGAFPAWRAWLGVACSAWAFASACGSTDRSFGSGGDPGDSGARATACSPCVTEDDCESALHCVAFPGGRRACAWSTGSTECCEEDQSGSSSSRHCETYQATGAGGGPSSGGAPGRAGATGGDSPRSGGAPGTGGARSGGAPGAGGRSARVPEIGRSCTSDAQCGEPLRCVTVGSDDFDGGGPAGGICTIDCSQDLTDATSNTCGPIDATSVCVGFTDTVGFCLEGCEVGPPRAGASKCHDRLDIACFESTAGGIAFCEPMCRGDFDCAGRRCDFGSGVCVDRLEGTLAPGAACDPDADACRGGICLLLEDGGEGSAFCSGACALGELGCGVDPASTDPLPRVCLLSASSRSDLGDLGFCAELCDCNDDCIQGAFVCDQLPGDIQNATGRAGTCTPATDANGQPLRGLPCR